MTNKECTGIYLCPNRDMLMHNMKEFWRRRMCEKNHLGPLKCYRSGQVNANEE